MYLVLFIHTNMAVDNANILILCCKLIIVPFTNATVCFFNLQDIDAPTQSRRKFCTQLKKCLRSFTVCEQYFITKIFMYSAFGRDDILIRTGMFSNFWKSFLAISLKTVQRRYIPYNDDLYNATRNILLFAESQCL